jgi:hypothetical protein
VDRTSGAQFLGCGFQHLLAASADVDGGPEFEESLSHAFAEAGAAACDEDSLALKKVFVEHVLVLPA